MAASKLAIWGTALVSRVEGHTAERAGRDSTRLLPKDRKEGWEGGMSPMCTHLSTPTCPLLMIKQNAQPEKKKEIKIKQLKHRTIRRGRKGMVPGRRKKRTNIWSPDIWHPQKPCSVRRTVDRPAGGWDPATRLGKTGKRHTVPQTDWLRAARPIHPRRLEPCSGSGRAIWGWEGGG